jgi:uncharacterized protein
MPRPLLYWCKLYAQLINAALCVDIETTHFNGPISVMGVFKPEEGPVESLSFVRGRDLSLENLRQVFAGVRLLITFNGVSFDIPRIRQEFPGVLPDSIPVLDLYRLAWRLGLNTNLKVLENTFGISRLEEEQSQRFNAVRLWKRYAALKDEEALRKLVAYNRQDTINLYPLANYLVGMAMLIEGIPEILGGVDQELPEGY